jgi:hypothetical protein
LPEFAGFIDINLASLLGICLPKLLANPISFDSLDEDPTLGSEICGTVETEIGCEGNLIRMEEMKVWIVSKVNWSTFPINLERVGLVGEAPEWRAVIWKRAEVLVFSSDSLSSVRSGTTSAGQ